MAWIWAELDFASLYSYRMPNLSPGYALTSPLPSPAALRLALVDAAIRSTGKVSYGEEIFEIIKSAPLEMEPPESLTVLKFFIKRLKPSKPPKTGFEESFGVREYCHFLGPLKFYLKISDREVEIANLFRLLRRLGTTDTIARGEAKIEDKEPMLIFTCKETTALKPEISNLAKRPVSTLNEIKPDAEFSQVNPYAKGKRGNPCIQKIFVLPLTEDRRGENWVLYRKYPFVL